MLEDSRQFSTDFSIEDFVIEDSSSLASEEDKQRRACLADKSSTPRYCARERFVKGPIPAMMIRRANETGRGKALGVLLVIFHLAGMKNRRIVKLSGKRMREFGITRFAGYEGLKKLELAGLVKVKRHQGRCPVVKIILPDTMTNSL